MRGCVAVVVWGSMLVLPLTSQAAHWPRFHGPDGSGVSGEQGIPTAWSPQDYAWSIDIPGEGHGAPVIWGKHLFVTTATDNGQVRHLLALDAETGVMRWTRSMGFNKNRRHEKNSFASTTPVTDGERVYVTFADQERYALTAYSLDGELLWRRWLGPFSSQHGVGASPIVFEDLVIVANDQDGPSSIVAFDRRDGRQVWSTLRASREASYATPIVIEPPEGKRPQLICVSGATGITSLDPWTGEPNWGTELLPQRTVASPVYAHGWIYGTCGQGGKGSVLLGVDPLNVDPANHQPSVRFRRDRSLPYVPCLIGLGEHLYLWNDNGVVSCVDPLKDETIWEKRIGGNYSGSPVCIDGKLYAMEESGRVRVVNASPVFEEYAGGDLSDPSHSTPAVANGRLYLRSFHKLTCLPAAVSTGK